MFFDIFGKKVFGRLGVGLSLVGCGGLLVIVVVWFGDWWWG